MQPARLRLNRRDALRRLSAGVLLAMGTWPGTLRADNAKPAGRFRFIVVNDTHHMSPECTPYLAGAVHSMKAHAPSFCLHCGDLTDTGESANLGAVHDLFRELDAPMYPVIGNHDYRTQTDR